MSRRIVSVFIVLVACLALGGVGPVYAADAAPTLTASVTFNASSYVSGQPMIITVRVHNSGTTALTGVNVFQVTSADQNDPEIDSPGLWNLYPRATIDAGQTLTLTRTAHPTYASATTVTFSGEAVDGSGSQAVSFSATVPIVVHYVKVTGQVFGDANNNGRADRSESLRGATVNFSYPYTTYEPPPFDGREIFSTVTRADGKFTLTLPTADYYAGGGVRKWTIVPRAIALTSKYHPLSLRAVLPVGKRLTASVHFAKHRYAPGAKATIAVTLANTGSTTLRGVGVTCSQSHNNNLTNTGKGWGVLRQGGPGVVLPPHSKRTYRAVATVPLVAQKYGSVELMCNYGYPRITVRPQTPAQATADVPGQFGAVAGQLIDNQPGPAVGVKGVRVVLVDATQCPVFSRSATTDAQGYFRLDHVPAGQHYQLYLFPPRGWKVYDGSPSPIFVLGHSTSDGGQLMSRGSAPYPRVPTKCR